MSNVLLRMALRMNAAEQRRAEPPTSMTRLDEDVAMKRAVAGLVAGAKKAAQDKRIEESIRRYQAHEATRKASAPAPALPPVASNKPKTTPKPATLQAPGRKTLPDGWYRHVPGKGLVQVDPPPARRSWRGFL